jgi:hypothetical protein
MSKFFDSKLAAAVGYEVAIEICGVASDLHADLASSDAIRKARGKPTFGEEEAENRKFFRELIAEGYPLDPDVIAWALED